MTSPSASWLHSICWGLRVRSRWKENRKVVSSASPLKGYIADSWDCGLSVTLQKTFIKARGLGEGSKPTHVKWNQRPDPRHSDFIPSLASCDTLCLWLGLTLTCGKGPSFTGMHSNMQRRGAVVALHSDGLAAQSLHVHTWEGEAGSRPTGCCLWDALSRRGKGARSTPIRNSSRKRHALVRAFTRSNVACIYTTGPDTRLHR